MAHGLALVTRNTRDVAFASLSLINPWQPQLGVPKVEALWEATYFAGLRKAGMAEE